MDSGTRSPLLAGMDDEPAFFDHREDIFTKNSDTSWVDFKSSTICDGDEDPVFLKDPDSELEVPKVRIEQVGDVDRLWEIAKFRRSTKMHAFFIRQKNSNGYLLLNRRLFEALTQSNGVFERFKEVVMSFGRKQREFDIGPPPCRFVVNGSKKKPSASFSRFECSYGLRYVEENGYGQNKEPWSVRQVAVYHKFFENMHTWIFISPSSKMERKVNKFIEHISASEIDGQINPLELHLVLIQAVLANWRWYIKSLVDRATEQSSRIIAATAGRGNSGSIDIEINFADRQVLKVVEDRVLDLITIFESTADTISTILERYGLIYNTSNNQPWHDQVTINLKDNLREVELYRKKADTLHKMVQGTASLLSDLLDYENAKTAEENSKALAVLAQESREENITMRKLTEEGTKDAAAVKVITLITILFLPTTVVSGFFSTQFVKQSDDGRLLELTDNWWLIVAVALPLTGFTILVWYCWMKYPWKRWWCQLWNGWRPSRPPGGTESEKPNSETSEPTHLYHRSEDNFSVGSQLELGVQGSFDEIRYKHSRRREIRDKDPG